MSDQYRYPGRELELFERATNWKSYWSAQLFPYIGGDVLEVGAGIGANTALLSNAGYRSWSVLEPDVAFCAILANRFAKEQRISILPGTIADLDSDRIYDTILYLDVLEHIEEDAAEIKMAFQHLREGGHLIVLAPAHESLMNEADLAIGHYRRYNKKTLARIIPDGNQTVALRYLDCVGIAASLANRCLLRQEYPSVKQIMIWDQIMIPISRLLDPLLRHRIGKSVLGVWRAVRS